MNLKGKERIFKKMVRKYGDILTKDYIREIIFKSKDPYEIEIEICKSYAEELEYNKNEEIKYNLDK